MEVTAEAAHTVAVAAGTTARAPVATVWAARSHPRGRATVSQRGFPHVAQATVSIRGFPRVLFTGLLRPPAMPEDDGESPSSPDIGGVPFADAADLNIPATSAFVRKAAVRCMLGARGRAGSTRNRASSTGICGSRMGVARSMHAGRGGHECVGDVGM